jgi:type I restriction enzyme S subunit
MANLGSVCKFLNGGTPKKSVSEFFEGDIPWITSADISGPVTNSARSFITDEAVRNSAVNKVAAGSVLLVTRTGVGKVALAANELCFSQDITALIPDKKKLTSRYLVHFLRTKKDYFLRLARGATIQGITRDVVSDLLIPLPNISDQDRIAAILDQADALRGKRREALAQLDSLMQSIFIETFRDVLSSKTRLSLSHYVEEFRYGTSNKSGAAGYPALRIPNVTSGSLNLKDLKTVEVDDADFLRLRLRQGDLLFVRTNGNPDNVGRCAVFNPVKVSESGFDSAEFIYASYLIRARMKSDTVLPVVLQQYLSFGEGRQALRARSKTSAGQFNINTEGLGTLPIPTFPMPLQESFVARKMAIEKQQAIHKSSLAELDSLFASLQHRAFRGEL